MEEIPNFSTQTLSSVPIEMLFSETGVTIATGTGFFYKLQNSVYLITNWHNLTGVNPNTKEPLSNHAGKPDVVRFPLFKRNGFEISWFFYDCNLYFDNSMLLPAWFVHPIFQEKVDVIAFEFIIPEGYNCVAINDLELGFKEFNPSVADDVYILGFPYNIRQKGFFPIWKRASIASEPEYDYDEKPVILVDTASRSGMSGSPVIIRRNAIWTDSIGTKQCFLGIYSGRITGKTEFEAQLGIVWKKHLINEIIIGKTRDNIKNFT